MRKAGLQYVALQVCDAWNADGLELDGVFEFKNPYGYLPATYFGFLPFEFARSVAFLLVFLYFAAGLVKAPRGETPVARRNVAARRPRR